MFYVSSENIALCMIHTLHKKVKDICQYLNLKTKIKANSSNITKHLENLKISLTFFVLCNSMQDDQYTVPILYVYSSNNSVNTCIREGGLDFIPGAII